jgi:hypothetical protein
MVSIFLFKYNSDFSIFITLLVIRKCNSRGQEDSLNIPSTSKDYLAPNY